MDDDHAAVLPRLIRVSRRPTPAGSRSPTCRNRAPIGATIGTSADLRLIQYLQALPGGASAGAVSRWRPTRPRSGAHARHRRRRPGLGPVVLGACRRADAALAEAAADFAQAAAGVHGRTSAPSLLANETFLRSSVDHAIASLTADGTIQAILDAQQVSGDAGEMTSTRDPGECASMLRSRGGGRVTVMSSRRS